MSRAGKTQKTRLLMVSLTSSLDEAAPRARQ